MQQQTSMELRAWFRNVEPLYAELFNAAHAMCGNYDLAEYALRSAILDVWLQNAEGQSSAVLATVMLCVLEDQLSRSLSTRLKLAIQLRLPIRK